jgi:2-amino-4-hydroxy-6-hydroxymethyldihydropteridine diphosphokinase
MNLAYLLLGSNLGDRSAKIANAIAYIHSSCGVVLKTSSLYETEAWGFNSENKFLNQVILIDTAMQADDLLQNILNIELLLGRVRKNTDNYNSREIDIDILFFNDEIIYQQDLKIPHPLLQERRFTLLPLSEIASEIKHPVLNKTIKELLSECNDQLKVTKQKD